MHTFESNNVYHCVFFKVEQIISSVQEFFNKIMSAVVGWGGGGGKRTNQSSKNIDLHGKKDDYTNSQLFVLREDWFIICGQLRIFGHHKKSLIPTCGLLI